MAIYDKAFECHCLRESAGGIVRGTQVAFFKWKSHQSYRHGRVASAIGASSRLIIAI